MDNKEFPYSWIAMNHILERECESNPLVAKKVKKHLKDFLADARRLTDKELIKELSRLGYKYSRETFCEQSAAHISAQDMAESLIRARDRKLPESDRTWLWYCIAILWERWLPERPSLEMIHQWMFDGYDQLDENPEQALLIWRDVWNHIFLILQQRNITSIEALDEVFVGAVSISHWLPEFTEELIDAGDTNTQFYEQGLRVCEEAIPLARDPGLAGSLKKAKAEFVCLLKGLSEAEALYENWLRENPKWGEGWIGWAECHWLALEDHTDYNRAIAILKRGAAVPGVTDELAIMNLIINFSMQIGDKKEAAIWSAQLLQKYPDAYYELEADEAIPQLPQRSAASARRNDPCPCGSGLKYKKCCINKEQPLSPSFTYTKQDEHAAIQALVDFSERKEFAAEREKAMQLFWPKKILQGHTQDELAPIFERGHCELNFVTWFLFDYLPESRERIIDTFQHSQWSHLPLPQQVHLRRMNATYCKAYEVQKVHLDKGLELRDLWSGDKVMVRERAATHSILKWDILITRLMRYQDGLHEMQGSLFVFPPDCKNGIRKRIDKGYHDFCHQHTDTNPRYFFRSIGHLFHHWWLKRVAIRPLPELRTTDGEPLVPSKAIFSVQDQAGLRKALDGIRDFERLQEGEYVWKRPGADRSHLGSIHLKGSELILETLSRERLELGMALLKKQAGKRLHFDKTIFIDAKQLMEEANREVLIDASLPAEENETHDRLVRRYYDEYYKKWIDEPVQALKGKTPREASKRSMLRARLVNLLKQMENAELRKHQQGQTPYNFSWLWKDLGLADERK